jgi:periplasmic protein TonB
VQEPAAPAVAAPSRRPPVQTTPPASPQQVPPSPTPTPTAVAPVVLQPPSAVAARPSRTAWAVHEAEPSASADPTAAASAIAAPAISAEAAAATHAAQPLPLPLRVARPDHSHCPPAAYPALLRERGIEGVVQVRVRVGADGSAAEAVLDKGSGFRLFDEAAVQRALGCRFVPARRGTESIESWVDFPVRFALIG